ncbi:dihydroorotase [bacterium]|jgi:dihydroorotase|nr:dihydroorotase [bacterium]MBP5590748.1 dihydroorotase [bacterium]
MKLVVKNGTVVNPLVGKTEKTSIVIENGVVTEITKNPDTKDAEVFDADGLFVAPGFIDIHVHFRDPGFEYKEDIISGLEAAAAGGFTSVCTMPNTKPAADNVETIRYMYERASKGNGVKLYPIAAATKELKGESLAPIGELAEGGAIAISDDGRPIQNTDLLKRVMEYASTFDMMYVSHSEDLYLSETAQMNEGYYSTVYGMTGCPVVGEASQIARDCMMAEYLKLPIHIAHVSAALSVDIIKFFKERGAKITAETAPHYITLTDEALGGFDTNTKINPPLRSEADRLAVIKALKDGIIDAIATDHAPHHQREKEVEFNNAPSGIVGLETALPLVLKLYHDKELSIERIVELFTAGYKIMGLEGGKIEVGAPADITVFDPAYQWTVDKNMFKSKSHNTPFHGFHVKGAVSATIVNGKIIYSRDF